MSDTPVLDERIDGRRRRSADSRARIVAAMLELVAEREHAPPAEAVASRASVGLRTVFRHFRDMESLYSEMTGHVEAEIRSMIAEPLGGTTWRERLVEVALRRTRVFEEIAPYQRASATQRHLSPVLAAGHARLVAGSRAVIASLLPHDLPHRAARLEALDLVLSFEVWDRLRLEQGLSAGDARAVVQSLVERVMAD